MVPQCPDCVVDLQRSIPTTALQHEKLRLRTSQPQAGFLGTLGAKQTVDVYGYICPECGLVRWYADLEK